MYSLQGYWCRSERVLFSELLDNLRPVSPKPGHAERVRTPSYTQSSIPELEEDVPVFNERFLKINVRHITDGQGVVGGVLLVTPNAVMFDPNVSDSLVIEHGSEAYGVIAPMDFVVNVAIYHDIAHMRVGHIEGGGGAVGEKPEIYYAKPRSGVDCDDHEPDSLMVKDETFPELVTGDDAESVCSSNEREGDAFPKAFERDLVTPTNLDGSEHNTSLEERRKSLLDHHWAIPSRDRAYAAATLNCRVRSYIFLGRWMLMKCRRFPLCRKWRNRLKARTMRR